MCNLHINQPPYPIDYDRYEKNCKRCYTVILKVLSNETIIAIANFSFYRHFKLSNRAFEYHDIHCRFVTIISDGSKAFSGSQDKSFRVWDLDTSSYLKQDRSRGHSDDVIDVAVAQDGSKSVSACKDGTLKIWKCATGEECFTMRGI